MTTAPLLREEGFSLAFCTFGAEGPRELAALVEGSLAGDGHVLQERIVAPPGMAAAARGVSARGLAPGRCAPPLLLEGHPDLPWQYASVVARALAGTTRVAIDDRAALVAADGVTILYGPPVLTGPARTAAGFSAGFAAMHETLRRHGMGSGDIARTWLFLDDVCSGYEPLNQAREAYFREHPLPPGRGYPASTGIEARLPGGNALALEFCAFSGGRLRLRAAASPLQGEAAAYGKLFGRATAVDFPRNSLLFVSGTAAIDAAGASLFPGDAARQMERTLEVVSAILGREGADFSAVVQAIVYLKRAADLEACREALRAAAFPDGRALFQLDTPVCRDELLCEVEVVAVTPSRRPAGPC